MNTILRVLREQVSQRLRNSIPVLAATVLVASVLAGRASAQFIPYCYPGYDALACPCVNPPASFGSGCNNFGQHTGGALLTPTGQPSVTPANDTLLLSSTAENNSSLSIFIQGTATFTPGFIFGAGVRCVGGVLKRMYTGNAFNGAISRPGITDPDVATRSANPPGPIDPLSPGDRRYYFVYYRDPLAGGAGCPGTFNCTQAVQVQWQQ